MPQDKLQNALLNRPAPTTGDVQYPKTGPRNIGDDALRAIMVGLGLEEQQPGDAASAVGGMAGIFGVGSGLRKLLKFLPKQPKPGMPSNVGDKMLREHGYTLPPEFHSMPEAGTLNDISREEIDKAIDLARPRPHLERPKPVRPKDPRADGTLPKHKEVVPAYRSKSGMAVDVLGDMKGKIDHSMPPRPGNYDPTELDRLGDFIENKFGHRINSPEENPVGFVAKAKASDDTFFKDHNIDGKDNNIDHLIQNLSDYFTTPKFDPFVKNKKLAQDVFDDFKSRGLNARAIPRAKGPTVAANEPGEGIWNYKNMPFDPGPIQPPKTPTFKPKEPEGKLPDLNPSLVKFLKEKLGMTLADLNKQPSQMQADAMEMWQAWLNSGGKGYKKADIPTPDQITGRMDPIFDDVFEGVAFTGPKGFEQYLKESLGIKLNDLVNQPKDMWKQAVDGWKSWKSK